jgi:hypothetical protein
MNPNFFDPNDDDITKIFKFSKISYPKRQFSNFITKICEGKIKWLN